MPIYNLGRYRLYPQGEFSPTATYRMLDLVTFQGSSWICRQDNTTGIYPPTNVTATNNWMLCGAKGDSIVTLTQAQINEIVQAVEATNDFVTREEYEPCDNNFTDAYKDAIDNIGDATIRIQKNGNTVASFSTNQQSNQTINITVPQTLADLGVDDAVVLHPVVTIDDMGGEPKYSISDRDQVIMAKDINSILIDVPYINDGMLQFDSVGKFGKLTILFSPKTTGTAKAIINIPTQIYKTYDAVSTTLNAGTMYMLVIENAVANISQLQ